MNLAASKVRGRCLSLRPGSCSCGLAAPLPFTSRLPAHLVPPILITLPQVTFITPQKQDGFLEPLSGSEAA